MNAAHELHEMTQETYAACIRNGADLSLDGYRLRLSAARAAIRFRHPEKRPGQHGYRMFVHNATFRASFAASTRKIRRIIRRLTAATPPPSPDAWADQRVKDR